MQQKDALELLYEGKGDVNPIKHYCLGNHGDAIIQIRKRKQRSRRCFFTKNMKECLCQKVGYINCMEIFIL